jgi:hypothetical protein
MFSVKSELQVSELINVFHLQNINVLRYSALLCIISITVYILSATFTVPEEHNSKMIRYPWVSEWASHTIFSYFQSTEHLLSRAYVVNENLSVHRIWSVCPSLLLKLSSSDGLGRPQQFSLIAHRLKISVIFTFELNFVSRWDILAQFIMKCYCAGVR